MSIEAQFAAATAAHGAGELETAERLYRAILAQADHLDSLHNLAVILERSGRYDEAGQLYRRAVDAAPGAARQLLAWATFLRVDRRPEAAEPLLRQVLAWRPDDEDAAYQLGMTLLALGRQVEGWAFHDLRQIRRKMLRQTLRFPEWRGEPLAGKRLFILREQGFGDQIMMARFLPRLAAAEVTYLGPPQLHRLFADLGVSYQDTGPGPLVAPPHDYWTLPYSLPRWSEPAKDLGAPYLTGRAETGHGRIGVVWRGEPANSNNVYRSLPPDQARRLLELPGAVSLDPADTGARDFQATADIIAGLDLVITIDTAVAHLAAGMGRPVWVLLAAHATDWQWAFAAGAGWYPSARLFWQATAGDWTAVVDRVCTEAAAL